MATVEVPEKTRRDWRGLALGVAVGVLGIVMLHHPMIFSGFRRMQVDLQDTRLINYLLEHNYLWYLGAAGHESFWDPPFFHPARNIAAYSDTMLGIAPLYAAFRVAGFAPDTAFQLWMVALSALNYAAMLHFLTRRIGLSPAAASAGSFLFAFGSPRANMLAQQTQMTQFLSLVSVDALFGLFAGGIIARPARALAWVVAAAGMLAQLSSAFYPGWFTVLGLGIVSILALGMPSTRRPFLATLRRDAPWIALAGVLSGIVIRPWLAHHLAAAKQLGPRWIQFVWRSAPRPTAWFDTGPRNWLGSLAYHTGIHGFATSEPATPLGIGLVTTVAVAAGLHLGRGRASTRLLTLAALVLMILLTLLPEWLIYASKGLLILGPVAFAHAMRKDHPRTFAAVLGLVLLLVSTQGYIHDLVPGFGLFTLVVVAAASLDPGEDRRGRVIPGLFFLAFSWTAFQSFVTIGYGAAIGGLLAVAGAVAGPRSRSKVEILLVAGFLVFASLATFGERPRVLLIALAAPVALVAARLAPSRPPARWLIPAEVVGLGVVNLYIQGGWAWLFFYIYVPGASSMIFISRVGLILLIPAAIGLGLAIDALRARGRAGLAVGLGLICLIEQGTTTPAFDKLANREAIAALARRVDDRSSTFFYTPAGPSSPVLANLDAMWAGLARARPTINGYSGHTPKGWRLLDEPEGFTPFDLRVLIYAMDLWKATNGREVPSTQWIGGPTDPPGRFPEVKPGDEGNRPLK